VFGSTYKSSTRQITRQQASGEPSGVGNILCCEPEARYAHAPMAET